MRWPRRRPYSASRTKPPVRVDELEQLVVEQIPRLRRYARALTGDPAAADDLVQDCLLRGLSGLHRWRRGSDMRAWLFTILHNVYVNTVRRRSNGPSFVSLDEEAALPPIPPNQEQTVEIGELAAALAALPPEQKSVVLLIGLEEMSYEEVAQVLDIPIGTVMSRLHRARERLRRGVAGHAGPGLRRVK
jgi:RNA polymerase sigma-70 factor, ECF subfamily